MGTGRTVGTIAGGVGGAFFGPAGAMLGAAGGGMLGGLFDDQQDAYGEGPRAMPRNTVTYRGLGADAEADRASQLGVEGAARTRALGGAIGADALNSKVNADYMAGNAQNRSDRLYGDAAGMYGRAEGNAADSAAARGDSMAAIGRLRSFYEQGPGPSAAEAQLRMGNDANARNAMSIARTGGGSPSAVRAALRAGAAGGAQTNQQAGVLRAQEAANWQNTRLNAMGQEQGALANVRAGDVGVMGQRFGAAGQQMGAAGQAGQLGLGYGGLGAQYGAMGSQARLSAEGMASAREQAGENARGSILGGQLNADASRYGADKGVQVGMANVAQRDRAADMQMTGSLIGAGVNYLGKQQTSDVRAKENIQPVSAANLVSRLDALESRAEPANDLRAARGYSYDYTDPKYGRDNQVGPMAQDLEHTAASGAVSTGPDGMKSVDPNRLTMTNTAAIGEQQRRLDALEAMVADKDEADWQPKGAATQGQRTIRKTEAVEGRRMGADEMRAMATFGHSGSLKPEDEEFINATSPRTVSSSRRSAGRSR